MYQNISVPLTEGDLQNEEPIPIERTAAEKNAAKRKKNSFYLAKYPPSTG